mmetsp:Transcript_3753/g.10092  ORF Transcript_3753/g.10092 Transcript_3753/m.10092 type:complete len:85 (-) Transcript_3753:237-491(-)
MNNPRQSGREFWRDVERNRSAQEAEEDLRRTGSDLKASAESVAALGAKLYDKTLNRFGNEDRWDNSAQPRPLRIDDEDPIKRYW